MRGGGRERERKEGRGEEQGGWHVKRALAQISRGGEGLTVRQAERAWSAWVVLSPVPLFLGGVRVLLRGAEPGRCGRAGRSAGAGDRCRCRRRRL